MFIFVAVLALIGSASAQVELNKVCDEAIIPLAAFNTSGFMGDWYQIYKGAKPENAKQGCVKVKYEMSGEKVSIISSGVFNHTLMGANGTAGFVVKDVANFTVEMNNKTGFYLVTDTDYNSYAVIYSCVNTEKDKSVVTPWLISRTPHLAYANLDAISKALLKIGVETKEYQTTSHTADACHQNNAGLQQASLLIIAISALLAKFL